MISRFLRRGKTLPARFRLIAPALAACLVAPGAARAADARRGWPQFGRTPQHTGESPALAQPLETILADVVYDPFVDAMKAESQGDPLAHYPAPLADETGVYMAFKSGTWTGFGNWETLTWSVKKLAWIGGRLEVVWSFDSDWKPEPLALAGWEPLFQPAISGDDVFVPGLGGTVFRVSRETGQALERINPFADLDPSRYVAGGLAVGPQGSVVYDVVGLTGADQTAPIEGAWLVRVTGSVSQRVDFAALVPGAPAADAPCQGTFSSDQAPLPPSPDAVPPTVPCGAQRPGLNAVPAISPDGTIYIVSRAQGSDRYGYLVAVRADLTPAWAASLRGRLSDGCGVLIPYDGSRFGCRPGAKTGVDPATNDAPAGRVNDAGTSSPAILPDGSVILGVYTSYNYARGHLFEFDSTGNLRATYDFGWDITPAVVPREGSFGIVLKDNHYFTASGTDYYDVTLLDPDLSPVWSYRSTNTESCVRQSDGSVACVSDHPTGFEWCVNQPAVDAAGRIYLNSEDGTLYAFDPSGAVVGSLFIDTALGAAYTPIVIGPDGLLWAQNNGHLFAIGAPRFPRGAPGRPAGPPAPARRVGPR
ncbi:MAG: hypothetical protein ACM3NW_00425 [Syntrophomonadaceae bacterium]